MEEQKTETKEIKEEKPLEKKEEIKIEKKPDKRLGKKEIKKEKPKKTEAFVKAKDIDISTKQATAICSMIRNKNPQKGIEMLEKVLRKELAVPCKGEIPHKKRGHRISKKVEGRYPQKASRAFIKILKNLIANAGINGLDTDQLIITKAEANQASRPVKPTRLAYGRKKFKRTHIYLIAKEIETEKEKTENKEKTERRKK